VIGVNLLGRWVTSLVKAMNLNFWNKLGGGVFGLAKGLLLCSTMLLIFNNFQWTGLIKEEVRKESLLYPYVEKTVPYLYKGFDLVKGYAKDLQKEEEEPQGSSSSF
jgi:membrane protein required for colicin V production